MIGYVTVGTSDLKKAGGFYDKICGEMGMGRFMANDRIIAWGGAGGGAGFGVALPYDGKPMTVGNGVMAAFGAKDKAQVDRVHKLALSLDSTPPISAIPKATSSTLLSWADLTWTSPARATSKSWSWRVLLSRKLRIIRLHPWPAQA